MSADTGTEVVGDILTTEERQAYDFAHNLYNGDIKVQAVAFLGSLGLSDEEQAHALGVIAGGLEGMTSIEEKRQLARAFASVSRFMGATATDQTGAIEAVPHETSTSEDAEEQATAIEGSGTVDSLEEGGIMPNTYGQNARLKFLSAVFTNADTELLESLTDTQLLAIGRRLGDMYTNLSIPRLNDYAKRTRVRQMKLRFLGCGNTEIAEATGTTGQAIFQGLKKMPESIHARVEQEEIDKILSDVLDETEV